MMKVGGVTKYEADVQYFKHRFSFKIYHIQLYVLLFVRQMP